MSVDEIRGFATEFVGRTSTPVTDAMVLMTALREKLSQTDARQEVDDSDRKTGKEAAKRLTIIVVFSEGSLKVRDAA